MRPPIPATSRRWCAAAEQGSATPGERLMLAHGALGPALRGESIDEVRRLSRASLAGSAPDVTSPTAVAAQSFGATALFMTGELTEAERALTSVIARARDRGAVLAFGALSHVRAHVLHRQGRLDDAIADAQSALDTVRYGWEPELPAVYAVLALCLIERGELGAAEAALEVPGGEKRWGATFTWADVLEARGRVRLARGDARAALEDFLACGERLKPLGTSHCGVVPWRPGGASAALELGEIELAGELAAEEVELSRAFGATRELGLALRTAGIVAGADRGHRAAARGGRRPPRLRGGAGARPRAQRPGRVAARGGSPPGRPGSAYRGARLGPPLPRRRARGGRPRASRRNRRTTAPGQRPGERRPHPARAPDRGNGCRRAREPRDR